VAVLLALLLLLPCATHGFRAWFNFRWSPLRPLLLYSAVNYAARFFIQAPPLVLPLIVLSLLGPAEAGYLVPALLVFRAVTIVPTAMGNALFAAGSREPGSLARTARGALLCLFGLTAVACAAAVLLLPPLLSFLGRGYAEEGRSVLVAMSASALPWAVAYIYLSIERVRGRPGMILAASLVPSVLSTAGAALLMPWLGLVGAGAGFLCGQFLGACVVAAPFIAALKRRSGTPGGVADALDCG
jgi:O-antigen/teichoic acid export membrane protein